VRITHEGPENDERNSTSYRRRELSTAGASEAGPHGGREATNRSLHTRNLCQVPPLSNCMLERISSDSEKFDAQTKTPGPRTRAIAITCGDFLMAQAETRKNSVAKRSAGEGRRGKEPSVDRKPTRGQ